MRLLFVSLGFVMASHMGCATLIKSDESASRSLASSGTSVNCASLFNEALQKQVDYVWSDSDLSRFAERARKSEEENLQRLATRYREELALLEASFPFLTRYEILVVKEYTISGAIGWNTTLRENDPKLHAMYDWQIDIFRSALKKMRNTSYQGTVIRRVDSQDIDLRPYYEALHNRSPFEEKAFLSTSTNEKLYSNRNVLFNIKSTTGIEIAPFAPKEMQYEKEVIFLDGTKFMILNIEEAANSIVITMEEIPER